jgi:hypothetical protein
VGTLLLSSGHVGLLIMAVGLLAFMLLGTNAGGLRSRALLLEGPPVGTSQNPTPTQDADSPPVGTSQNPDALLVACIDYQTLAPGVCQRCRQKSWERLSRFVMYSDIRPPAWMRDRAARLEAMDRLAQQVARQQERGHFKVFTRTVKCTSCLNNELHHLGLPAGIIERLRRMAWDKGYEPATRFAVFAHFTHGIDVTNDPSIVTLAEDDDLPSALANARADGVPSDALEVAHGTWIFIWSERNAERFGQHFMEVSTAAKTLSYERRLRDPILGDMTAPGGPGPETLGARILREGLRRQALAPTPDAAGILGPPPSPTTAMCSRPCVRCHASACRLRGWVTSGTCTRPTTSVRRSCAASSKPGCCTSFRAVST